jgi:very-short-patch-repair endonuclease
MRPDHWRALTSLAVKQDGLVTTAQVTALGIGRTALDRARASGGLLVPVRRGVHAVRGAPHSERTPVRAALMALGPDAVASHRTAAWLHGLLSERSAPIDVIVPVGSRRRAAAVHAHESELPPYQRTSLDGLPVTNPARTIVDLAAVLPAKWIERILNEAVMRHLCRYEDVAGTLAPGRPGAAALRPILAACLGDTPLEAHWHRLLTEAGLPPPKRQFQVVIGGQVYVLDYAWPASRVALEANGFDAHRTRAGFDRDHDKALALQSIGWTLYSVTSRTDPAALLPLLTQSIRQKYSNG